MPATDRSFKFPRSAARSALGASIFALLLLMAAPAVRAAPCTPGASGVPAGCNAGATGPKVAGATMSPRAPVPPTAPVSPVAPCVRGVSGVAGTGCTATASRSMIPGMPGPMQNMMPGRRDMRADGCGPGVRREGMADCNAGPSGAVVQGVMTLMQMLTPMAPLPR